MHRFLEGLCIIRLDLSGVIQAQMLEYSKFRVHSTWKAKIGLFPSTNSLVMPVERNERKRKPHEGHAPYKPRKPKQPTVKNPPKTSAQPSKSRTRSNLTLNDWLTVIAYVELLNPIEEREVGDSVTMFPGGDEDIVAQVNYEMAVKRGEVVEIEDDDEDEEDTPNFTLTEMIKICETMEELTLAYGNPELRLGLSQGLRKFRVDLQKMQNATASQATLDQWMESAVV